ncbi:MAG: hypothetical protein WCT24_02965 [Patescibacteria group bacterium]|jgi:hypothetical protein
MSVLQQVFKFLISLGVVVGLRLLPHPPNVEPIMATMMPFSKRWGWLAGMIFCLVAILGYDFLTGTFGSWSYMTAGTYAVIGAVAGLVLRGEKNTIWHYVVFSVVATLFYDAVTGIGMGVLLFKMPLMMTITGQIPFTLYHLAGNIVLAATLSPLLHRWVMANPKLEVSSILKIFKPATEEKM